MPFCRSIIVQIYVLFLCYFVRNTMQSDEMINHNKRRYIKVLIPYATPWNILVALEGVEPSISAWEADVLTTWP